jgi:Protein of unknown function (DUF2924)
MDLNVGKEVAAMKRMTVNELRAKYADVFGEETKARHKEWLVRRIAWRMQALAEGDISERARQRAAGRVMETIQNYKDGYPATKTASSSLYSADQDLTTGYGYDSAGRLATQTAINAVGYNVLTAQNVSTSLGIDSSPYIFLMYSVQDIGGRWAGSGLSGNFVVVKYNGTDTWQYDDGSALHSFTPCSSDVLVASIDMSGSTPASADRACSRSTPPARMAAISEKRSSGVKEDGSSIGRIGHLLLELPTATFA